MNLFERQRAWQQACQDANDSREERRDRKNFRLNLFLMLFTAAAAIAALGSAFFAGWSATHPTVVTIPQPSPRPAGTAPTNSANAK